MPDRPFAIRPGREADLEALVRLFSEAVHGLAADCYDEVQRAAWAPASPDLEEWRRRLAAVRTLVAQGTGGAGEIAGFLSFEDNGRIDLLYTSPAWARRGVAAALFQAAAAHLADRGVDTILAEASLVARPFFLKQGFQVVKEETVVRRGVAFRRFIMARDLSAWDLHRRLREATKAPHRDLDHHPLLAPLVRADLTARQYGLALMALHGVYAALEDALGEPAAAAGFAYRQRLKVPAMAADLADLGLPHRSCRLSIPRPGDIGTLVGMLYTIEGSALGAQVICRQLAQSAVRDLPRRYFSGYGDATREYWQAFWTFAREACPAAAFDAACAGAVLTFRTIKAHLDEVQAEMDIPGPFRAGPVSQN